MSIQLAVISLWAQDVPAAAHFYRDVIGLPLLAHHGGRPHFKLGEVFLTILQGKPMPAQDPDPLRFPVLALAVDDLEAALENLRRHNVELPWGVESDEGMQSNAASRWVMFHDPGGNLIELVQFGR